MTGVAERAGAGAGAEAAVSPHLLPLPRLQQLQLLLASPVLLAALAHPLPSQRTAQPRLPPSRHYRRCCPQPLKPGQGRLLRQQLPPSLLHLLPFPLLLQLLPPEQLQ